MISKKKLKSSSANTAQSKDIKSKRTKDIFDKIDQDGSGLIEFEEFAKEYLRKKPHSSVEQARVIFDAADKDNSGGLDLKEVSCWCVTALNK